MPILDLFSKRMKRARGEQPDVFSYEQIPSTLRAQVVHIVRDAVGIDRYGNQESVDLLNAAHDGLAREYGIFHLTDGHEDKSRAVMNFVMTQSDHERVLDTVEVLFRLIDRVVREREYVYEPRITASDAISELNDRFREAGVGYEFDSGNIVRVDSKFLHAEAVKPVLNLLSERPYRGADEEFRKAHEHYRSKSYKEAINECLKSLESVLKTICAKRKWRYEKGDTASRLIRIVFDNGLLPRYLESQMGPLRSLLESGVPTVRNRTSGHGQGQAVTPAPDYLASYVLHLTATSILFLVQAEKHQ